MDVNLCETVITKLLADVEQISYDSKKSKYLTEGNKEQDNNCELLRKMDTFLPFHEGSFKIAEKTGCPIIPK